METEALSSNWKKLQSTLHRGHSSYKDRHDGAVVKRGKTQSAPRKARITPSHDEEPSSLKMDKTTPSSQQSKSLMTWAVDNDIAVSDLAKAYDSGAQPGLTGGPMTGVLNEGVSSKYEIGRYVALDCEMVGVGGVGNNERSVLARASVVNYHGEQLYDSFVKPREAVTNWRTPVSGVRPSDMVSAREFATVQRDVARILQGRILVGHSVHHDLKALFLSHPRSKTRDTSQHPLYQGLTPRLKTLAEDILGVTVQEGAHSSVDDARTCMLVYRQHKEAFEQRQHLGGAQNLRPQRTEQRMQHPGKAQQPQNMEQRKPNSTPNTFKGVAPPPRDNNKARPPQGATSGADHGGCRSPGAESRG